MKKVLVVVVMLLLTHNVYAEECNTTLKETDSYQELSIILNCLSRKVENLEKELKKMKEGGTTSPSTSNSTTIFESKFYSMYGLKLSKNGDMISLTFIIKSKSDKDLFLAILTGPTVLTDDLGNGTNNPSYDGLKNVGQGETRESAYTVMTPGVPIPVTLRFSSSKIKGKEFALRVAFSQLTNDKPSEFSMGKTNIKLNE